MSNLITLLFIVAALALSGCGEQPTGAPTVSPAPAVHPTVTAAEMAGWPRTVEQAVTNILGSMSEEDKQKVRATKREDLIRYHHGWGTGIRNGLGLWRGNRQLLADCNAQHPDDASMVIIDAVWERLQKP